MGRDTTQTDEAFPEWWPYGSEFPDWHVWRGVSGLLYARRPKSSPPLLVRGEDMVDLRDEIIRAESPLRWSHLGGNKLAPPGGASPARTQGLTPYQGGAP